MSPNPLVAENDTDRSTIRYWCRSRPDTVFLPKRSDVGEPVTNGFAHRHVVGVSTTVVPTVAGPELAELCAPVKSVPVDAHDICWRVS